MLVTLDGLNFAPDLEAGWFDADESSLGEEIPPDELVPKLLKFSCTMTVLHKRTIGFNSNNEWPDDLKSFPNVPSSLDVDDRFVGGAFQFGDPEAEEFLSSFSLVCV